MLQLFVHQPLYIQVLAIRGCHLLLGVGLRGCHMGLDGWVCQAGQHLLQQLDHLCIGGLAAQSIHEET